MSNRHYAGSRGRPQQRTGPQRASLTVSFRELEDSHLPAPAIVGALSGDYDLCGKNFGRPVYSRRRRTAAEEEVCIYNWDDAHNVDSDNPGGWWFGRKVGENKVWAWNPSSDDLPPELGWEIGGELNDTVELVVSVARGRAVPSCCLRPAIGRSRSRESRFSPPRPTDSRRQQPARQVVLSSPRRTSNSRSRSRGPPRAQLRRAPQDWKPPWAHGGGGGSREQHGGQKPDRQRDLRIELGNRGLDDARFLQWIETEGPEVIQNLHAGGCLDSVDLSDNQLTDEGCRLLVKWLLECHVPARRLRLFKNQLRSPAALCGLIEDGDLGIGAEAGLRELHLSSNKIDEEGIVCLLDSICRRKNKVGSQFKPPLWLRLERNAHSMDEEAVAKLAAEYADRGLSICLMGGKAGSGCTIQRCTRGADVHIHIVGGNKSAASERRRAW